MKRSFTSVMFLALFLLTSAMSFAGTFFVCSAAQFKLKPDLTTTFTSYEWSKNAAVVSTSATPDLTQTVTLATATAVETVTYSLRVKDATGCWSTAASHTVYVLPVLTVSISGGTDTYCSNEAFSSTLTASSNRALLTGLPTGASVADYVWTGGTTAGTPGGTNNSVLTFTSGGTYNASLTYTLPTNDGSNVTSCSGTASKIITIGTAPTTPTVTLGS